MRNSHKGSSLKGPAVAASLRKRVRLVCSSYLLVGKLSKLIRSSRCISTSRYLPLGEDREHYLAVDDVNNLLSYDELKDAATIK